MCYNENKGGYVVKKNGCTCSDNCFNTHYGMMGT